MPTEVERLNVLGLGQRLGGVRHRNPPHFQDDCVVRHPQGHRGVLLHQDHRGALGVDGLDDVADLLDELGGQSQRGFIQKQHGGLGHQRSADGQHLLLTAGEETSALFAAVAQHLEQVHHPIAGRGPAGAGGGERSDPKVLLDRHPAEDLASLRGLDHPSAGDRGRLELVDRNPVELDGSAVHRASVHRQGPGDRPQQRGLARSVAAEDRDDPSVRNRKVHRVQDRLVRAVSGGQARDAQQVDPRSTLTPCCLSV